MHREPKRILKTDQKEYCWREFTEARRTLRDLAEELGVSRDTVQRGIQHYMQQELKEQRRG